MLVWLKFGLDGLTVSGSCEASCGLAPRAALTQPTIEPSFAIRDL